MAAKKAGGRKVYRVLKGINYPGPKKEDIRREVGETADDIPQWAIADLEAQGAVEEVNGG